MSLLFNMLSRLDHFNESWVFDEGGKLSMVTPDSVRAPNGTHFPLGEGWCGTGHLGMVPPRTCTNSASFGGSPDLH